MALSACLSGIETHLASHPAIADRFLHDKLLKKDAITLARAAGADASRASRESSTKRLVGDRVPLAVLGEVLGEICGLPISEDCKWEDNGQLSELYMRPKS